MILGVNQSYWSWEYDSITVLAHLNMNITNGKLNLSIKKIHHKSGLGAGTKIVDLDVIEVGTLIKPNKALINSTLTKHKLTDCPFRRDGWSTEIKDHIKLADVIEEAKKDVSISRAMKLYKIKKLIK